MATPLVAPAPFVPLWSNAPTFRDTCWSFLLWSALMVFLGGSAAMVGITEAGLHPYAAWGIFLFCVGPGALLLTHTANKHERAMHAAVTEAGHDRIARRSLALVAALAPSWTETRDTKEPLDITVWWEASRHGMVATDISVYSPTRKKVRQIGTDDDGAYGLRLVPWQPSDGGTARRDGRALATTAAPRQLAFRFHLPPLTAHNRMALAAAAAPGFAEHQAEAAAHGTDSLEF